MQGILRSAQVVLSYMGNVRATTRAVRSLKVVLILELNVVVVVFLQILILCNQFFEIAAK